MAQKYKYPRTYVLPWSEHYSRDDLQLDNLTHFKGRRVVVTVKMDGENTTLYRDGLHARSLAWQRHESRAWIANFHAQIKYNIPADYRICGENLFAKHSIHYHHLPSYFLAFNAWHKDFCLSWEDTLKMAEMVGVQTVPVLWEGNFDHLNFDQFLQFFRDGYRGDEFEGYVVRLAAGFTIDQFPHAVAKCVRKNHVQTNDHWLSQKITKNGLEK